MIESSKMYLLKSFADSCLKFDILNKAYEENEHEVCKYEKICSKDLCKNYYLYTKKCSNDLYKKNFFECYCAVDQKFFSKIFDSFINKKPTINICIIGGGNLYELDGLSSLLNDDKYSSLCVNVCIIDKVLWPHNIYWYYVKILDNKNVENFYFLASY